MILSITLSKPTSKVNDILGADYERIKIRLITSSAQKDDAPMYMAELYTQKQVFHKKMTEAELSDFIEEHAGKTFKSCVERTETEEITILANKKGKITTLKRPTATCCANNNVASENGLNRIKNYILEEGKPVPFLVHLGVMTAEGAVIASKYDKFRQINRFLEFIDDIIPDVTKIVAEENKTPDSLKKSGAVFTKERPLRIADFGCGKSYLTFAVYYYLTELKNIPVEITGLDLKKEVIEKCSSLAEKFGYENLHFYIGNIADFSYKNESDIIITLHACDTATDYALSYAIKHNAKAILSVPCCQHEINLQLEKNKSQISNENPYSTLLRYGLIRERFAALATDAMRAELLEQSGYSVQILEFIDMEHTPKNILIRAIKKQLANEKAMAEQKKSAESSKVRSDNLIKNLGCEQTLEKLLES